jgi:cellulose synthase/poly-beta-1,6-N-acetylglucosamine synthase-like glycosyltransferase
VAFLLLLLAVCTLLFIIGFGIDLALGNRATEYLKAVPPWQDPSGGPVLSIIVPARNEEKHIEAALQSLLNQNYRNTEILVVDDRSSDGTAAILDKMAQVHNRLRVFHIEELPEGWLGKNHALYYGARHASGEFLLFADADVVMHPSTVSRAIRYMVQEQVDHVTVGPEIDMPGLLLRIFAGVFTLFFALYARPWKAKDPRSSRYVGIGAFNLVRTSAYHASGTHATIAMRPDDDMKLGKILKNHGFKQRVLFAEDVIRVEWYSSFRELVSGLEKNAFAGIEYSLPVMTLGTLFLFLFFFWPFPAISITSGFLRLLNLTIIAVIVLIYCDNARFHKSNPWYVLGFPFAVLLFIYILWNSTISTLRNDGISWRGTHYPLSKLKANRV